MLKELKTFILRGNVMDMAVGVIMGGAFGKIVSSLVDDVIMPPVGLLIGSTDFRNLFVVVKNGAVAGPYETLEAARAAGAVSINLGIFINNIVSFLIIAFSIFFMLKAVNKLASIAENTIPGKKDGVAAEPTTKVCPFCFSEINIHATRCPHCTSEL